MTSSFWSYVHCVAPSWVSWCQILPAVVYAAKTGPKTSWETHHQARKFVRIMVQQAQARHAGFKAHNIEDSAILKSRQDPVPLYFNIIGRESFVRVSHPIDWAHGWPHPSSTCRLLFFPSRLSLISLPRLSRRKGVEIRLQTHQCQGWCGFEIYRCRDSSGLNAQRLNVQRLNAQRLRHHMVLLCDQEAEECRRLCDVGKAKMMVMTILASSVLDIYVWLSRRKFKYYRFIGTMSRYWPWMISADCFLVLLLICIFWLISSLADALIIRVAIYAML